MLNYVESVESETGLVSGGDQLMFEAMETSEPDKDSQTTSRHEVAPANLRGRKVQRNVELIRNAMIKKVEELAGDVQIV